LGQPKKRMLAMEFGMRAHVQELLFELIVIINL
jgi:hypothetical protein